MSTEQPFDPRRNRIDWFIANLHELVGHDTTARFLGVPAGDKRECLLCHPKEHEYR